MRRFYPLEKLINLHDGYRRKFRFDHVELLLTQHAGTCHIFESRCPHEGHPLDSAVISTDRLQCPRHQYVFALSDGQPLDSSTVCRQLKVYQPVYEGRDIGVMLDNAI